MSEVKGTKALELWCKRLIKDCPDVHIDNMTTSWRNGIAFCALVHHFRPDLIDISKLKPENIYENNQLAYSIAEKHLGIPALLDPEDMVENEVPDRLSILTYLSQFYQRLGHTVSTKVSEQESKVSPASSAPVTTPFKFGKVALDKCTICGLPVYLAQRLIVSQKLYHRRCFRCSKCSGHLNPKNFHTINSNEFSCDSCKNEMHISKYLNNNDQIGMLAFSTDICDKGQDVQPEEPNGSRAKSVRPLSILEKISMFESKEKDSNIDINKLASISLKDNYIDKYKKDHKYKSSEALNDQNQSSIRYISEKSPKDPDIPLSVEKENSIDIPEKVYKSNIDKFNFLQTQLSDDILNSDKNLLMEEDDKNIKHVENEALNISIKSVDNSDNVSKKSEEISTPLEEISNITDDSRIAHNESINTTNSENLVVDMNSSIVNEEEIKISVPPRKKKQTKKNNALINDVKNKPHEEYPDHLNPFSDDEEDNHLEHPKRESTNPFGSSEEEDESEVQPEKPPTVPVVETSTPVKRLIKAYNPFWSDDEEPSSDEESGNRSSNMYKSNLTTSTPNLPDVTPKRRKPKAPPPPPSIITEHLDVPSTSLDDVASLSSMSSHTSTVHSDQKSYGNHTPRLKKKRTAPTPPDSLSTLSGYAESTEKADTSGTRNNSSEGGPRRVKGPAPGLPLPSRREVKPVLPGEQLQAQLDLLETQQLGLERQGVLLEQMIRDKCEGNDGPTVPQEEIEDLVIQLCELVNEKNDLFRKQTELMYIRRQQRLEQEQADIEHEIRVLQSQPAVNRIDADKAREEQLVSRLVSIVRQRDELVQQLDAERRRERQEDRAIAASIASKRAQRHSDSSMKSAEAATPGKKNKVKDKVKKQFKKAKHTLIPKKKDEEKSEKEKKSK